MATIREIAKACNVSITTVSNIIHNKPGASEKTKQLVLEMIDRMDYRPNESAQKLKLKHTKTVGVMIEDMTVFNTPEIVDGITECCEEQGYQIILMNLRLFKKYSYSFYRAGFYNNSVCGSYIAGQIRDLMAKRIDGMIYVSSHERQIPCIPEELDIPVTVAYGYTNRTEIPHIVVDDTDGGFRMMDYLLACGHQRIGIAAGRGESIHTQSRLRGCQRAMFDHQILFDPDRVFYGDWGRESGFACARELMKKNVTAIFCMNDLMAAGVYDYLMQNRLRPGEDLSVAGYDNRSMSEYYLPPLTTMALPLHRIGFCAGQVILDQISGRPVEHEYSLECELKIRDSVRKL